MDRIVLDTNVVLDWLLFRQPTVRPLCRAIEEGRLCWLVSARMREEFEHMVRHPRLARWSPDLAASMDSFDRWGRLVETGSVARPGRARCSDPDDQVFIDVAIDHGARWLVSRDRALLKLGRRARSEGVRVLTPETWLAEGALDPILPFER